jgi:AcrR family transcriptional regulator
VRYTYLTAVTLGGEESVGQTTAAPGPEAEAADEPQPRRTRGDRTRAALVDAALALFAEQGVEETSVDEITARAAVAKGTFYVHFQRKQDILLEQAARLVSELQDVVAVAEADPDPAVALGAIADRLATIMTPRTLRGRAIREIIGNREQWLRVLGDRPSLGEVLRPIIRRGQADGVLRTDLSSGRLAHGLTILWLDTIIGWSERSTPRDLAEELHEALTLFLGGAVER